MYRSFLYLVVGVFITGCFNAEPEPLEYPDWYDKPPVDNVKFYGVAKGETEKEAKQIAENMIMANILMSIAQRDPQYKDIEKVKKIAPYIFIDDVSIEESEELSDEVVVTEVSIVQKHLFEKELSKADALYLSLNKKMENLDTSLHPLKQFAYLSKFEKSSHDLDVYLSIIKVIKPSFSTDKYNAILENYRNQMIDLRLMIAIKIFSDADALEYLKVIQESFAQNEIVTLITSPSVTENITLKMFTNEQRYESQSYKMVKMQLQLIFIDEKGKEIAKHRLILIGKSKKSYQDAERDSALYLKKMIQDRGFFEVLGL